MMTQDSTQRAVSQPADTSTRVRWAADLGVVGGAITTAIAIWVLLVPIGGVDLDVGSGETTRHVGLVGVVIVSALAAGLGLAALQAFRAALPGGRRWWTVLAATVLMISLLGPLSAATAAAGAGLACLHCAVGGVIIMGGRNVHRDN